MHTSQIFSGYNKMITTRAAALVLLCLAPVAIFPEPSYSRIGNDGLTVAEADSWYLEEYDPRGRPVRATQWVSGEIASVTSWLYEGDSARCESVVTTDAEGSVETRFDGAGNDIYTEVKDASGATVSFTAREWDEDRRELLRRTVKGDKSETQVWTYREDGTLSSRRLEKNGTVVLEAVYESADDWVETVYRNGAPVLVQRFLRGVREGGQ